MERGLPLALAVHSVGTEAMMRRNRLCGPRAARKVLVPALLAAVLIGISGCAGHPGSRQAANQSLPHGANEESAALLVQHLGQRPPRTSFGGLGRDVWSPPNGEERRTKISAAVGVEVAARELAGLAAHRSVWPLPATATGAGSATTVTVSQILPAVRPTDAAVKRGALTWGDLVKTGEYLVVMSRSDGAISSFALRVRPRTKTWVYSTQSVEQLNYELPRALGRVPSGADIAVVYVDLHGTGVDWLVSRSAGERSVSTPLWFPPPVGGSSPIVGGYRLSYGVDYPLASIVATVTP